MNDLLRAYGGMDVVSGVFAVYSEMTVKDGKVDGYLKPLFKDLEAYDPAQDQDKGLLKKIYEKTINVASAVLKNTPRGEAKIQNKRDKRRTINNTRKDVERILEDLAIEQGY